MRFAQTPLLPTEREARKACGGVCAVALIALTVGSTPVLARDDSPGFLLGDEFRYGQSHLLARTLADLVAIPAHAPSWEARDWGLLLSVSTVVVGMMVPLDAPPDVLLQDWVHQSVPAWRNQVWTPITEVALWGSVFGGMGLQLYLGLAQDRRELVQLTSLMVESFAVAQLYQLVFKLSLGREGPMDADGRATIHGPQASLGLFPAGTPSGHAASFFALIGSYSAYWSRPELTGALVAVGMVFGASLVISDYHFASDVLWGGAMGWAIGEWVVRHRGDRGLGAAVPPWLLLVPRVDPRRGEYGAALAVAF